MSTEWRPKFTLKEYTERIVDKGREIEEHLKTKHNGLPTSTCHKCMTLSATLQDLKELQATARKFEESL